LSKRENSVISIAVKSDFYFAGILQLLGVILANKLGKLEKFRSIISIFN